MIQNNLFRYKKLVSISVVILVAVVLVISGQTAVFADDSDWQGVSTDQQKAWELGVDGYDVDIGCSSTTTDTSSSSDANSDITTDSSTTSIDASAFTSSDANTRMQAIFSYLVSKGLTKIQAAAAVGNIAQESGGVATRSQKGGDTEDPSSFTTTGHGWGLIQWDPGAKVIAIAKGANVTTPIYLATSQLDVLLWHMKNETPTGAKNMLAGFTQTDIEAATLYFEQKIEGAGKPVMANRYAAAKIALTYTATDVSTSSSDSSCSNGASQSLVSLIQQYAWPDNSHGTTPTTAYAAATAAAKTAGQYVGSNGIDCGAFITRLMQNSGYDSSYGGGGNTVTQLSYVKAHPEKYQAFTPSSTADLRFGDIAIKGEAGATGHTFMYIGTGTVSGFSGNLVEASLDKYAPRNTNNASYYFSSGEYSWFHLIGSTSL